MKEYDRKEGIVLSTSTLCITVALLYLVLNCRTDWECYCYYLSIMGTTTGALCIGFFCGNYVGIKLGGETIRDKVLTIIAAGGAFWVSSYVLMGIFGIGQKVKVTCYLLFIVVWPLWLSGLAWWADRHFGEKERRRKVAIYVLSVCCGMGVAVVLEWVVPSLMKGVRPDHVLYFLIMASVIGYRTFGQSMKKRRDGVLGILGIAVIILEIVLVVFLFQPRCREVVFQVWRALSGQTTEMDWVGYRMAAARAYWLHDFAALQKAYPQEGYLITMEEDGLIKLAYDFGTWTSIVFILLEIGICLGLGKMYEDVRSRGILKSPKGWMWNGIPYFILSYGIRTLLAVVENTFMFRTWKMELPFTGTNMAEMFFLFLFLQQWWLSHIDLPHIESNSFLSNAGQM